MKSKRRTAKTDHTGAAITEQKVADAFSESRKRIAPLRAQIVELRNEIRKIEDDAMSLSLWLSFSQIDADLRNVSTHLRWAQPFACCLKCKQRGCKTCRKTGWLPREVYERLP